jgi:hypothetical protein
MILVFDFDGVFTLSDSWPKIGALNERMIEAARFAQSKGHTIALNTCREWRHLSEAIEALANNGLVCDLTNENDPSRINQYGSDPRKVSGDMIFDDRAFGWDADKAIEWLNALPRVKE